MNQALLDKIESEQYRKGVTEFGVGDSVRVSLLFELEGGDCQTTGHLLRVASSDDGIWKQEVAVRFDERLTVDVASVVSGKS